MYFCTTVFLYNSFYKPPKVMTKRTVTVIFAALTTLFCTSVYAVDFGTYFHDRTLRIDYLRKGCAKSNTVEVTAFVSKSGTWAGSLVHLIDPFDYGTFRIVVKDAATGTDIYTRTYNSLFQEYEATPAGRDSVASFQETVLVPYPKAKVKLCFQQRDKKQRFVTQKEVLFDPATAKVETRAAASKPVKLLYSGDSHKKLDVVIVADGYTKKDAKKMEQDMQTFAEQLVKMKPYKDHKADFNIWGVGTVSEDHGISNPKKGRRLNTALGSSFDVMGIARYLMTYEVHRLHDAIGDAPYEQIIIMSNSEEYGGGAIYNFYANVVVSSATASVLPHEFGHTFAGLADEYIDEDISYEELHSTKTEPLQPNITSLVAFDKKWKDLVEEGLPVPTPVSAANLNKIGAYEGGGYRKQGIYRPAIRCMMGTGGGFCAVCKRAINAMFEIYTE